MTDVFDKKTRSRIMSTIKCKDTKPELKVRKQLYASGIKGYRIKNNLPGKPDLVFKKNKLVVFIDGDFWHGYNWKILHRIPPKEYWQKKIAKNMERDKKNNLLLKKQGWRVLRFWEHNVKKESNVVISKIIKNLMK